MYRKELFYKNDLRQLLEFLNIQKNNYPFKMKAGKISNHDVTISYFRLPRTKHRHELGRTLIYSNTLKSIPLPNVVEIKYQKLNRRIWSD